jgi:hypothetical protein
VTRLNPRGQISLDGRNIQLSRSNSADPIVSSWQLNFDMHQASLDCGVELDSISGSLELAGHGQGEDFSAEGELNLDSVRWHRFFFDGVQGPLYADPTQVVFGQRASQTRGIPLRRITANAYGGRVEGDAVVTLGHPSRFSMSANYQAGDLRRLVTETWPTRENVKGSIYGTLQLQGTSLSPETVSGQGAVALSEAELYHLPQVIRLFKMLRGQEPDQTAFTQADARFQVSGRQVYFEDLKLKGDAVSLHGGGTVDFVDQRLRLVFSNDPVPSNSPLTGLRTIMRQASRQVMLLHVGGTISDPQFHSEPLAGLNHALQQILLELDPQARVPAGERGAQRLFGPPPR